MAGRRKRGTDAGYDKAAHQGGPALPDDSERVSYLPPEPPELDDARDTTDVDERETQKTITQVRRREHSAD